jgi:GxxExxY protein
MGPAIERRRNCHNATVFLKTPLLGVGALHAGERRTATNRFDELSERVIGCAIAVHRELGPGLLESIYRECLVIELAAEGLHAQGERHVTLAYRGQRLSGHLVVDLLVEDNLVVEVKAVERIVPVHLAQLITYLKLTGYPVGLLMNFNATTLRSGLRRCEHPDRYVSLSRAQEATRPAEGATWTVGDET